MITWGPSHETRASGDFRSESAEMEQRTSNRRMCSNVTRPSTGVYTRPSPQSYAVPACCLHLFSSYGRFRLEPILPQLLEPFHRLDRRKVGVGRDLSISSAEGHGGSAKIVHGSPYPSDRTSRLDVAESTTPSTGQTRGGILMYTHAVVIRP